MKWAAWVTGGSILICLGIFSPVLWSAWKTKQSAHRFFALAKPGHSLPEAVVVASDWTLLQLNDCGQFHQIGEQQIYWVDQYEKSTIKSLSDVWDELKNRGCLSGGSARFSQGYSYHATVSFSVDALGNFLSAAEPVYQD